MSSPFATTKEFMEAKGPIYTFANNSTVSSLFLLMSLAITIYFFYSSYAMHQKKSNHASQNGPMLGLLLVTGLATSLASMLPGTPKHPHATTSQRPTPVQQAQQAVLSQPIAVLLGLMGGASTVTGKAIRRQFGLRKRTQRSRRR